MISVAVFDRKVYYRPDIASFPRDGRLGKALVTRLGSTVNIGTIKAIGRQSKPHNRIAMLVIPLRLVRIVWVSGNED